MVDGVPPFLTDNFFIRLPSPQTISLVNLLYTHLVVVALKLARRSTSGLLTFSSTLYNTPDDLLITMAVSVANAVDKHGENKTINELFKHNYSTSTKFQRATCIKG